MANSVGTGKSPAGVASRTEAESSIRQLIANGKEKTALDSAKDYHKANHDAASESLLIDAYIARIQSLSRQNLHVEAKSLLDLVRERYPTAVARLTEAADTAAARSGELDDLLRPLADPSLSDERRALIERLVEENVVDLSVLAASNALAPDHPLRQSASALQQAFVAVTSGPVAEEAIALPEVSRRSPLAPWKLLVRAIACFHRNEEDACRQYLDAIKPSSAPARLVPVIRQLCGNKSEQKFVGAAGELLAAVNGGHGVLKQSLERLDAAFRDVSDRRRLLDSIRTAVRNCDQYVPDLTPRLRQHIAACCAIHDLDPNQVNAAMGAPARTDAYYLRLFARAMETSGNLENIPLACGVWDQFRTAAVAEDWFTPNGVEAATLYLHMAANLRKLPSGLLGELTRTIGRKEQGAGDFYYLQPEKLYERACALDPHSEAFAQWLNWALDEPSWKAEHVAKAWHKILPNDLEPVFYLMRTSERSGAFHNALEHLRAAERIDSLHAEVRAARPRLLIRNAMRQISQKKTSLAEQTLQSVAELPQAQQGDRPALLASLRYIARYIAGDHARAAEFREETERLIGRSAASLLIAGLAAHCKQGTLGKPATVGRLDKEERAALPLSLSRVSALLREAGSQWKIPPSWVTEGSRQFQRVRHQLDVRQLRALAQVALAAMNVSFAYAISAEGLTRGGSTEPEFLLLRAMALSEKNPDRSEFCGAAAAELARQARNMDLVGEALEFLRDEFETEGPPLNLEHANEVLRKEKEAQKPPTRNNPGPEYGQLIPCDCPECRRTRGEAVDHDDTDDDEDEDGDGFNGNAFLEGLPPGLPPEIAIALLEQAANSIDRGESFDDFLERITRGGPPPARSNRKKGKRRK